MDDDEFWGGPEAFKSCDPLPPRRVQLGQQRILRIVKDRMKTHPKMWTFYGETRCVVSIFQSFNHTMSCRTYSESRLNIHTFSPRCGRSKKYTNTTGRPALQQAWALPVAASNLCLSGLPVKLNRRNYVGSGKHTEKQIWNILACSVYSPPKRLLKHLPGNGPHLESHLEFLTKMSARYLCKMSFNPGLMCLNLLICEKSMESILATQITVC